MPKISELPVATGFGINDLMVIETSAGTRAVTKVNSWFRRSEVPVLLADELNVDNDRFLVLDGTDGLLKASSLRDTLFGDLNNQTETNDFTLSRSLHNIRPVQCSESFDTNTITLDGNGNVAGCNFNIVNFSDADLTVNAINGVSLRVQGSTATSAVVRQNRIATIVVSNGGAVAIFEGG